MQTLIALTGMSYDAKARLTRQLAANLTEAGTDVTLIDNLEQAVRLPVPTFRLPGGCVCCSLTEGLVTAVDRVETAVALLPVSAQAFPDGLALVLCSLRRPDRQPFIVSIVDPQDWDHAPYLAAGLTAHSDATVSSSVTAEELVALIQPRLSRPLSSDGSKDTPHAEHA